MSLDFEPLDLDEIAAVAEGGSGEGRGRSEPKDNKYVQLPERDGYVIMRILPRKKGTCLYQACKLHNLRTGRMQPNGQPEVRRFYSPKEMVIENGRTFWQGMSVIDWYLRDIWAQAEKATGKKQAELQQQYRDAKAYERYYFNVIVREQKGPNGEIQKDVGPLIFSCGKTVFAMIMRAMNGDKKAGLKALGDVTHPLNGRDFRLVKKVTKGPNGEYPNYDLSQFEDPSPLGDRDQMERWLQNLNDLSAIKEVKSEEELKEALQIHLGLKKPSNLAAADGVYNPDDFRTDSVRVNTAVERRTEPEARLDQPVREELTAPTFEAERADEEDVIADDDFLKALQDIE